MKLNFSKLIIYILTYISSILLVFIIIDIAPKTLYQYGRINLIVFTLDKQYGLSKRRDLIKILEDSAKDGFSVHQFWIGNLFEHGWTTGCNYRLEGCTDIDFIRYPHKAQKWYKLAALNNHKFAQKELYNYYTEHIF